MLYWVGLAALVQGLGLVQENPAQIWWNIAFGATKSLEPNHRLLGSSWGTIDGTGQNMKSLQTKCGMDLQGIFTKLTKLFTDGPLDKPIDLNESTPAEQVLMLNHVMEALTPKREKQCTIHHMEQLQAADSNFEKCTGVSNYSFATAAILIQKVNNQCRFSGTKSNTSKCLEALLSDEKLAGTLRDLYRNAGTYFRCTKALRNELPSCSVTVGDFVDKQSENKTHIFDTAYRDMKISLGFLKQYLCAVGLGSDAAEGVCADQLQQLDQCLNESPGCGDNISPACNSNMFYTLSSGLTQGFLPDICLTAYGDQRTHAGVAENFADFVEMCHPEALVTTTTYSEKTADFRIVNAHWIDRMVFIGIVSVVLVSVIVLIVDQMHKQQKKSYGKVRVVDLDEVVVHC